MKYIKTYRMNLRRTYARIIVKGKSGNEVVYDFTNGNPAGSVPAKCILHGEYEQKLLEESDFVKNKIISLEKVVEIPEESDFKDEEENLADQFAGESFKVAEDVTTVTEAINYCAEHFGVVVKTAKQALATAKKNGVDFPNLKIGK